METVIAVPTVLNRTRIPQEAILDIVGQIKTNFQTEKIILFGSYAYGNPGPESDVDLLVIMNTKKSALEQAAEICRKINYRFGLDLLVYTPSTLSQRLTWGDPFLKEIIRRGLTLYESADT